MKLREDDPEATLLGTFGDLSDLAKYIDPTVLTGYTYIVDGQIVGAAGVTLMWEGVGHAWCVTSEQVSRYPVQFCRAVKRGMSMVENQLDLHRIHAYILEDNRRSLRWVRYLGFEQEGIHRNFGPNRETFHVYVRLL